MAQVDELTDEQIDSILERFDKTEPAMQRRIVAEFVAQCSQQQTVIEALQKKIRDGETPSGQGKPKETCYTHTQGEWIAALEQPFTLGGDTVSVEALTPDGKYVTREICHCMLDTDYHPDGEQWKEDVANVRLIAAAPNLYHACKVYATELEKYRNDESQLYPEEFFEVVSPLIWAAIAKAELVTGKEGERR